MMIFMDFYIYMNDPLWWISQLVMVDCGGNVGKKYMWLWCKSFWSSKLIGCWWRKSVAWGVLVLPNGNLGGTPSGCFQWLQGSTPTAKKEGATATRCEAEPPIAVGVFFHFCMVFPHEIPSRHVPLKLYYAYISPVQSYSQPKLS